MERIFEDDVCNDSFGCDESKDYLLSQDNSHDLDVVWDWDSPQPKPKYNRRRFMQRSPKVPLKRHPSNNQEQALMQVREELKLIKEGLAKPDCPISILDEHIDEDEYKNEEIQQRRSFVQLPEFDDLEDMFNDSIDEDLLSFSQQIDEVVGAECKKTQPVKEPDKTFLKVSASSNVTQDIFTLNDSLFDDSFSIDYRSVNKPVIKSNFNNTSNNNLSKIAISRTKSEDKFNRNPLTIASTLQRAKSIDVSNDLLPQDVLSEIEKKRLEAKAKLEAKRNMPKNIVRTCSSDEVERKRLLALAKLEAKKSQRKSTVDVSQKDLIDRKHREALLRLHQNKMRHAAVKKHS